MLQKKNNLKIVFFGTAAISVPLLQRCSSFGEIIAVVTAPDARAGRGKKLNISPIKKAALELGLNILQPDNVKSSKFIQQIRELEPYIFILFAYGQILPKTLLSIPKWALNVHPSALPKYRGAAPIQRAIMAGERETAITIIQMSERVDAGGVLMQQPIPIEIDDTYDSLAAHVASAAGYLVERALQGLLDGSLVASPQSSEGVSKAPKIHKSERLINWAKPAVDVYNLIRAFPSQYHPYTIFRGKRLNIIRADIADEDGAGIPGTLILECGRLLVQCGPGFIELIQVQPEGKKVMDAAAFINGYRPQPEDILGSSK